jgi:hypothetical protein
MDFRLEFFPKVFEEKIKHHHKLMLIGSCFTEQIGAKLSAHKFQTCENPNGILFNPISITRSLESYISHKNYSAGDLFLHNELWGSWDHHTRFSSTDKNEALQKMNTSTLQASAFLKEADWLMITLGSAFVYELENNQVVANCHKVPTDKFHKKLLDVDGLKSTLDNLIAHLRKYNPRLKIIFTISPVRHLRDGFVENNKSKSVLINATHQVVENYSFIYYFPAYELVIDDLRDYRFYAEDMVHPNYAATNYVWEKFIATCIDEAAHPLMKEIATINAARNHKAFNPNSELHKRFLATHLDKIQRIQQQYPYINFGADIQYFMDSSL